MKILMIGNDPRDVGGVANYTRPLAAEFARLGQTVFYFYSGAWNKKYNWLLRPYLRINTRDFPFECAELINSPNWTYNFNDPLLDLNAPRTESLFEKYIRARRPDVVHAHSRLGLPASLLEIASRNGIRVFNTVHVYGFLCQKRVMVERDGRLCLGPSDLDACAVCPEPLRPRKLKFFARIERTNKNVLPFLVRIKKEIFRRSKEGRAASSQGNSLPSPQRERLKEGLTRRLDYMIFLMNHHVSLNLCVSSDVKRTLLRYGVSEEKLRVQPIGSVIAETQKTDIHPLHDPLVVGNIGGVRYYKGTHVLVDALSKLSRDSYRLKIFGPFDQDYMKGMLKGKENLPIEFLGWYNPQDLPGILEQIDIMVLPSICKDTAPQTIFESYSARIPIVASDIGGFSDFVQDGINGHLFAPGNSDELALKLDELLRNPDRIKAFSDNIPRLKTIRENARELTALYQETGPAEDKRISG